MTGLAWMALAQLLFAGMNVCTRLGARDLPWSEVAAVRFLVGSVAILVAWHRGSALRVRDQASAWRRSIYGTLAAVCTFYALGSHRIALGDVATLGATAPIFVALLSRPLLSEPVEGWVTFAVGLGFAGVVAVVRPSLTVAMPVALIVTVGAVFYALAMIWLRKIGPGESNEAVVLHFSLIALTTLLLVALRFGAGPTGGAGWFSSGQVLAAAAARSP